MSGQFGLFLGEDRIPVINWVNRHGSPEGRKLRFTVPTEVKAKLEANQSATYRLERGGEKWDFELLSVTQHGTGTNGVPAVGQVKRSELAPQPKPTTGVGIPKLESGAAADKGFVREKSSLRELLLKKKAERQTERGVPAAEPAADPQTVEGLPVADSEAADDGSATARGMAPVTGDEEE